MKDLVRAANRIAAFLPDNMASEWALVFHDTDTYKKLTEAEVEEAKVHLQELLEAKVPV